jgi:hypothetical protein
MAKKQIAQTGESGAGMAKAGRILGWINIILTILGVIAIIVVFVVLANDPQVQNALEEWADSYGG